MSDFGKLTFTLALAFGLLDDDHEFSVMIKMDDGTIEWSGPHLYKKKHIFELIRCPVIVSVDLERRESERRWRTRTSAAANDRRKN